MDEDLVEKVQIYSTKLVPSISHLPYEERLKCFKLPSLKYRRLCSDIIMTYNRLHGHLNVCESSYLQDHGQMSEGTLINSFKQFASREVHQHYSYCVVAYTYICI